METACFIQVEMQHYSTCLIQFIEFMTDLTDILYLLVTLSHFPQSKHGVQKERINLLAFIQIEFYVYLRTTIDGQPTNIFVMKNRKKSEEI